jgi:4'-phosphopantetheinyl transferase
MLSIPSRPLPTLHPWRPDAVLDPLGPAEVRVLAVPIGPREVPDEELEQFPEFGLLNEDERARARRFVRPRDRRRFLACRGALRTILGQLVGEPPVHLHFQAGPGGKPELRADYRGAETRPLQFNVTHSGDLALIAVALDVELGVDVEHLRPIKEAERIVASYFTIGEQAQFFDLDPTDREQAFLRGWTRKEAILKARGVGLAGLASSFETMFGTAALAGCFTAAEPLRRVEGWDLWEAEPLAGYVAALAVAAPVVSR